MFIVRFISAMLDRLFIVVGAFCGCQVPFFMHQYAQRLAGRIDELNYLLNQITHTASLSNKSLEQYIGKFLASGDSDFVIQGEFMQTMWIRKNHLIHVFNEFSHSSIWGRPFVFFKNLDWDMFKSTFFSFQPGFTFSLEALCYTGIGILGGYAIYQVVVKVFFFSFGKQKKNKLKVQVNN